MILLNWFSGRFDISRSQRVYPECRGYDKHGDFRSPFQGLEILRTIDPGRRSQTRFALGYYLSGFQPLNLNAPLEFASLR